MGNTTQEPNQLKQLRMQRSLLDTLPDMPPLTPGCAIITAVDTPAQQGWERIIADSFGREMPYSMITGDVTCADDRVFILTVQGEPGATASVQHPAVPGLGIVHMVGVHSRFLGHGYGRLMVLYALHHMQATGLTQATLTTDDYRLPAIRTYLQLGFVPVMTDDTMPARWDAVHRNLAAYRKTT